MNCNEQCFGCHGLYDVDDDIASSRRSSLNALIEDLDVEMSDSSTYDMYCWKRTLVYSGPKDKTVS